MPTKDEILAAMHLANLALYEANDNASDMLAHRNGYRYMSLGWRMAHRQYMLSLDAWQVAFDAYMEEEFKLDSL